MIERTLGGIWKKIFASFCENRFSYPVHPDVYEWCEWEQKLHSFDLYSGYHSKTLRPKKLAKEYLPQSSLVFRIPYVFVPTHEYSDFFCDSDGLSDAVRTSIVCEHNGMSCFRFFLHPSTVSVLRKRIPKGCVLVEADESDFFGTPTSSLRSLLIWRSDNAHRPFIVKVSVFAVSYGYVRHVDWEEARCSYRARALLQQAQRDSLIGADFRFLDEVAITGLPLSSPISVNKRFVSEGFSNKVDCIANIVREIPLSLLSGERKLIPCFAYMSLQRPQMTFIESIANSSGRPHLESLHEVYIEPILKGLLRMIENTGIILEPHAQNTLIETDKDFRPTGSVWYRDFSPIMLDPFQAFLKAPKMLEIYASLNEGRFMPADDAIRARQWTVKCLGYNFLFCNVSRALIALVYRNIISDTEAHAVAKSVEKKLSHFLQNYLQAFNEVNLFTLAERDRVVKNSCFANLAVAKDIRPVSTFAEFSDLREKRQSSPDSYVLSHRKVQTEEKSWYEHKHGLIEACGNEVIQIFPYTCV